MAQTAGSPIGLLLALTYATGGAPTPPAQKTWTKQQKQATRWTKNRNA